MSATVAEKAEPKPRLKKRKTKAERREINRANSLKSTGPRTEEGKQKSKYNPLKHGMTARTVLLPGEDATALAARQQQLIDAFQPRNAVELAVIERMAGDIWRSDRADLAAGRRISLHLRHEPIERLKKENEEAIELGARLLSELWFPLPISKRYPVGILTEPLCAGNATHPHHPARLRLQLEQTVAGCDWLLARWCDLMQRGFGREMWQTADVFKMVRLMGKHAVDMVDDLSVMSAFLSSLTLLSAPKAGPERSSSDWTSTIIDMLVTFGHENELAAAAAAKNCEVFARRLAEMPLAKLAPRDERHAWAILGSIIEQEMRRIHDMRQRLCEIAAADAAEAPARLAFELGPEGDRHRRYALSNERQVIKRFGDFLKTRSQSIDGTFDRVAVDLETLLGTAEPQAEAPAGIEPAGDVDEPRDVTADVSGVVRCENDGQEPLNHAAPTDVDGEALSSSREFAEGCYDFPNWRNEAIGDRGELREKIRNEAIGDGGARQTEAGTCLDIPCAGRVEPSRECEAPSETAMALGSHGGSPSRGKSCSPHGVKYSGGAGLLDETTPSETDGETIAPTPEFEVVCGDELVLRNEAKPTDVAVENRSVGKATDQIPRITDNAAISTVEGRHVDGAGAEPDALRTLSEPVAVVERHDERSEIPTELVVHPKNDSGGAENAKTVERVLSGEELKALRFARWKKQKLKEIRTRAGEVNDAT